MVGEERWPVCGPRRSRRSRDRMINCSCTSLQRGGGGNRSWHFKWEIQRQKWAKYSSLSDPCLIIPYAYHELIYSMLFLRVCGQNANRTKCQPDIMPTKGWYFVPTYFCGWHFVRPNFLVGILSGPSQHVLAYCQNHEKCHHLSECEWGFVRSVAFLPYRQKADLAKSQSQMTLARHSYEAHLHNSKCSEDDIRWSQRL